jgi:serine/threonine protein kinase
MSEHAVDQAGDVSFSGTDRFQVLRRLGMGGMGVVYEAADRERNTRVALKTLIRMAPETLLRLKNEFRALQDIHHPNLVSLGELQESRGRWFFTMELIEGVDFLRWVRPLQPPPVESLIDGPTRVDRPPSGGHTPAPPVVSKPGYDEARLRGALGQLSRGLMALHAARKVHRDVKPSNILVTANGRTVILDFGLVLDAAPRVFEPRLAGTVAFMAPEQGGPAAVGPQADWYSVGVLLYLALTGRLPIDGPADELLALKQKTDAALPSTLVPAVPRDLDALCAHLLRRNPTDRAGGGDVLRALGLEAAQEITSRLAFVGRKSELEALAGALRDSEGGHPVTVLVSGESGVGKSMLVRAFTDSSAADEQLVVLAGRCYERESVPYKAFDQVVDSLARFMQRRTDAEAAALLPRMASLLGKVFPVLTGVRAFADAPPAPEGMDPKELRGRVFAAMRELLLRLGDRRRVVCVIDDLQWADDDSLALLAEILRAPEAPRLLLVATVRTASEAAAGTLTPTDIEARLRTEVRRLELSNLPPADARELAELLARQSRGAVDAQAVAREAGGHPLFIDALVRHRRPAGDRGAVRLDDALLARVDALDQRARLLVELIAVAGGPLRQDVAAHAAELEWAHFDEAVAVLRGANLVRTAGAHNSDPVEPYHDRVRESVRSRLGAAEEAAHHRRLAQSLEAAGGADAEALTTHWRGAGDLERATRFAVVAAAQAERALAFDRAARLYRLALKMRPAEDEQGQRLRTQLGEALAHAGRGAEAAEAFGAAAVLARGDDALALQWRAAEQLLFSGHVDAGLERLRPALAAIGMGIAKTPGSQLLSMLFRRARLRLRGIGFRRRDDVSAADLLLIDRCFAISLGLLWVDVIPGVDFSTRTLLLALASGDQMRVARSLAIDGGILATAGPRMQKRTEHVLALARKLADEAGDPRTRALALGTTGFVRTTQGRWPEARVLLEESAALLRDRCTGVAWELATVRTNLLFSMAAMGDLPELAARGLPTIAEAEERGDLFAVTTLRTGPLLSISLAKDDPVLAREQIEAAMARWSQRTFHLQHHYALIARLTIDLYAGETDKALERLRAEWPALRRSRLLDVQVTRVMAQAVRARVLLARALATRDPALLRDAQRVARAMSREGLNWASGFGALSRAAVTSQRGDQAGALAQLDEAARYLEGCQMKHYLLATRFRKGQLAGGPDGEALMAGCAAQLRQDGVKAPELYASVLAPGFVV